DVLGADLRLGSQDDLHHSPPVAKIDERDAAVVAPTRHPAVELDLFAYVLSAQRSAVRGRESAQARSSGRSDQETSRCSPVLMSRSCATWRLACSALNSTAHWAPSLSAAPIFRARLRGS